MKTSVLLHGVVLVACGSSVALAQKQRPDRPAATWNEPPPRGVETVQPIRPTWCAGYTPSRVTGGHFLYDDIIRLGYTEDRLKEIARLACDSPDDPNRQRWIAFYRQGWLNIVGTTEREDREAMAARMDLAAANKQLRANGGPCARKEASEDETPADRAFDRLRAQAIGCWSLPTDMTYDQSNDQLSAMSYWIDRAAEPPDELVRLAFVLRCLNTGSSSIDHKTADRALGRYAFCRHDARKLARAAFDKALAARDLPPLARVRAREMFTYTKKLLADYELAFKGMIAKNPAYAQLVNDAPERGFAGWVKSYQENKAMLDYAVAMEEKFHDGDKRAVVGCGTSLRMQLKTHVQSRAPKTRDDVSDALNDDIGQPLLKALIACDSMEGRFGLVYNEVKLQGGRVRRGPRTAAFWSTMDALSALTKDDPKFKPQPNSFGGPLPGGDSQRDWMRKAHESTFNKTRFGGEHSGKVKSVKRQGDGVVVTFKTESWQEPTYSCKETNRVDRITADGHVEYRQNCRATGTQTVDATPPSAWIPRDLADGIQPGVVLKLLHDEKNEGTSHGFPLEVYADAKKTRPIQFWGFAVKP